MTRNDFCKSLDVGECTFTHYCMDERLPNTGSHNICDDIIHKGKCPMGKTTITGLSDGNTGPESIRNRVCF
jgi:hypothetical protein